MDKKHVISAIVGIALGLLGGFLGRDLTPFQKPAEAAVTQGVDAAAALAEKVAADKAAAPAK